MRLREGAALQRADRRAGAGAKDLRSGGPPEFFVRAKASPCTRRPPARLSPEPHLTANLRTKIMDFRGFDSSIILNLKGWNSHVQRGFPGNVESTNLGGDNLSREIGRRAPPLSKPPADVARKLEEPAVRACEPATGSSSRAGPPSRASRSRFPTWGSRECRCRLIG